MTVTTIKQERLNGYRIAAQGLTPRFDDVGDALRAAGWLPSRESAYLGAEARVEGFTRGQLDEVVFGTGEFLELAGVRGQSFVVPREMAAILIRSPSPGQRAAAEKVLDEGRVPITGRASLLQRVLDAIRVEARQPTQLIEAMEEERGAAARYLSMPGIMHAVLTLLRLEGLIVRTKLEPPLDRGASVFELTERALPGEDVMALDPEEALRKLCAWYFRVHGPATKADFGWWSGAGAENVERAFAAAGSTFVEVGLEDLPVRYFIPQSKYDEVRSFERTGVDPVLLVPFRDPWLTSHEGRIGRFVRRDEAVRLPEGSPPAVILHAGYVVGRWEHDAAASGVKLDWFRTPGEGIDERAARRGYEVGAFLAARA